MQRYFDVVLHEIGIGFSQSMNSELMSRWKVLCWSRVSIMSSHLLMRLTYLVFPEGEIRAVVQECRLCESVYSHGEFVESN